MSWQECVVDPRYEIRTEYPYPIRNKSPKYLIPECYNKSSAPVVRLNKKVYMKHFIVMRQFHDVDPVENGLIIWHINRDVHDYHLENLKYMTRAQVNQLIKHNELEEYVDKLPEGAVEIKKYNDHEFQNLWFDGESLYQMDRKKYRKLTVHKMNNERVYVKARDTSGYYTAVFFHKLESNKE
jgi:hypothetical protein